MSANRILAAAQLAAQAHSKQTRMYTGEPYINHCIGVAATVAFWLPDDSVAIAAALLHDTLEDTPLEPATISRWCGEDVLGLVMQLTDVYTKAAYPDLNRAYRKQRERLRYASITDPRLHTIKLADMQNNLLTINDRDANFAEVYREEARELLHHLDQGPPILYTTVRSLSI